MLEADDKVWDQNAFNDLMRRGSRPDPARRDRLFWCRPPWPLSLPMKCLHISVGWLVGGEWVRLSGW